jgi:DNA-binding transcriptional MerR regulator
MQQDDFVFETNDHPLLAPLVDATPLQKDDQLEAELKRIPDKLAFKIGEVADLVGVKTYVLRYWETEFEALSPKKSKNNQRMYERKDVETLLMIKKLLYRDRFSIEGARSALKRMKKQKERVQDMVSAADHMSDLKDQMQALISRAQKLKVLFK